MKLRVKDHDGKKATIHGQVLKMSAHNNLNWSDLLLCIGMELAFHKNGERPIQELMIAEKLESLGGLK